MQHEPILTPPANPFIFVLHSKYPDLYQLYTAATAVFWRADECMFDKDKEEFKAQTPNFQLLFKRVLVFFRVIDGIINYNLNTNFTDEVHAQEAKLFFTFQAAMENIHAEVYAHMALALIPDVHEDDDLIREISNMPCIDNKLKWIQRWMVPEEASFGERLVAFAAVESVGFSAAFAIFYFAKSKHILQGLSAANDFIARDEGMHVQFACALYGHLVNKLPQSRIHEILVQAVDVELAFIRSVLMGPNGETLVAQLTIDDMASWIKTVADATCTLLGCAPIYCTPNKLTYMDSINNPNKYNFFEQTSTNYITVAKHTGVVFADEDLDV